LPRYLGRAFIFYFLVFVFHSTNINEQLLSDRFIVGAGIINSEQIKQSSCPDAAYILIGEEEEEIYKYTSNVDKCYEGKNEAD
jgi:hypothetical protein